MENDSSPYAACNCRFRIVVYSGGSSRDSRVCCLKRVPPSEAGLLCLKRPVARSVNEPEDDDALFGPSPFEGPHSEDELEELFRRLEDPK